MCVATAYELCGRADKVATALAEALKRYERKGNAVMTRRTRARIDRFSARE